MTVRREIVSHVGRSVGSGVTVGVGVVGLVVTGGTYVGGAGVNCNNSVMEVLGVGRIGADRRVSIVARCFSAVLCGVVVVRLRPVVGSGLRQCAATNSVVEIKFTWAHSTLMVWPFLSSSNQS